MVILTEADLDKRIKQNSEKNSRVAGDLAALKDAAIGDESILNLCDQLIASCEDDAANSFHNLTDGVEKLERLTEGGVKYNMLVSNLKYTVGVVWGKS